jgi:hypothetical protein
MITKNDTIANRPAGKPVFDFDTDHGPVRVVLNTTSNDGQRLVMSGWAYRIDAEGLPVLDSASAAPIATADGTRTVELSGVMAGTRTLYDGWVKAVPDSGATISADALPEGWASGKGAPSASAAYGANYFDIAAGVPYTYVQGCLDQAAQSFAEALEAQINTTAKLATLGL